MKRMVIGFLALFFFVFSLFSLSISNVEGKNLSLSVISDPDFIAIEGSYLSLRCLTNLDAFLSVNIAIKKKIIIFQENIPILAETHKMIQIPISYPIVDDFIIQIYAETIDLSSSAKFTKQFSLKRKTVGFDKVKGRIIGCNNQSKTGIEGAKVEILSGPTIGSTYSEDDGYFVLNDLPKGIYKFGISHFCASGVTEKIVIVDDKTPFVDVCINSYGIADFDFWLNKPSGSNYEIGEVATFFLRSSIDIEVDLFLIKDSEKFELFNNFQLSNNEIKTFYWSVPDYVSIGEYILKLEPKDKNLCGTAEYKINFSGELKKGSIRGKVLVEGIPIKNVEVYLPLQFNPPSFTDVFGNFEIKNVTPGIHTLRFMMDGFDQLDLRGIEVSQNQITQTNQVYLTPSETIFKMLPNPILSITHERREKIVPLEVSLIKGYAKNITVEAIDFPEGIALSTNFIESLSQEKERVDLIISEKTLPNTYEIKVRLKSAFAEITIPGTITVAGLSFGTFDGVVLPKRNTIPQGYVADFTFQTNRFSNFNSPITIKFINLPPYTKVVLKEDSAAPPFDFHFTLESTLSTPPGEYKVILIGSADNQLSAFPFMIEFIKAGASLSTIPELGWNPILKPGQKGMIPIATYSSKGISKSVRVNLDFGPNWLMVNNRFLGNVSEQKVFAYLEFLPNEMMQPGGYDYSISFSYGDRNEGYKKFSGRIYILSVDPNIPSNLRAKFIEENKKIILTWGTPSEDKDHVIGYNVYKSLHYPSLETAFPLNKTLIKDLFFEDMDYKIGKTYWYVVKAVKADGFISKQSNTAEIPILTRDKINVSMQINKGERATYFVGEKLNISLISNISGTISLSIISENFSVLLDQKQITKSIPNLLSYSVPDIPYEATLVGIFISSTGQKSELKKTIFIKKSISGMRTIKGAIWNNIENVGISHAKISTFDGATKIETETDESGFFQINGLSEGNYRFTIESEATKLVTESFVLEGKNLDIGKIEFNYRRDRSLMAWTNIEPDIEFQSSALLPLFIQSDSSSHLSISIMHDWIERTLVTNKEVQGNRVYCEKLKIPSDIPNGYSFIITRDLSKQTIVSFRIHIKEPQKGVWGKVKDFYNNPINKATVSGTKTNEWGFFFLKESPNFLEIQKKNFISQKLDIANFVINSTTILLMSLGSVEALQSTISIAEDFNDFSFMFSSKNGISNHFQIKIDSEPETYESPVFDVFPDYIYRFNYGNLLQNQIHDESRLNYAANGTSNAINITKGTKEKIFLETDPEIIIVDTIQENSLFLDVYSYGTYKKNFVLSAVFWDNLIKSYFEPLAVMPGNSSSLRFSLSNQYEPGLYVFIVQVKSELLTLEFPLVLSIMDSDLFFIENQWSPMLYQKSSDTFNFFLSEKPKSIDIKNSSEALSFEIKEQSITFLIKQNQIDKIETDVKILVNQNLSFTLKINIEFIPIEQWLPPSIEIESQPEGIKVLITKNGYEQYYFINKSREPGTVHFLNNSLASSHEYIDKQVSNYQKFYYSLFSTNGRLEGGWSNQKDVIYNRLSLTMDLKDNTYTNSVRFLITGSISIGATLTINEHVVVIEKNGYFKTYYSLKEGKNTLLFRVEDLYHNKLELNRNIILDTIPPRIKMMEPADFIIDTTEKTFLLTFEANEEAYMTVNLERVLPNRNNTYEYLCQLSPGQNTFTVQANDKAGNQNSIKIQFNRYQKRIQMDLQVGNKIAFVDQKKITLDVPPMIVQGRTLVPLRFISDGFGAKIDWDATTKEIIVLYWQPY